MLFLKACVGSRYHIKLKDRAFRFQQNPLQIFIYFPRRSRRDRIVKPCNFCMYSIYVNCSSNLHINWQRKKCQFGLQKLWMYKFNILSMSRITKDYRAWIIGGVWFSFGQSQSLNKRQREWVQKSVLKTKKLSTDLSTTYLYWK